MIVLKCCELCSLCISHLLKEPMFVQIERDVSKKRATAEFLKVIPKNVLFLKNIVIYGFMDKRRFSQNDLKKRNIKIYGDMDKKRIFQNNLNKHRFVDMLIVSEICTKTHF